MSKTSPVQPRRDAQKTAPKAVEVRESDASASHSTQNSVQLLIIRFSSFGDIVQALSVPAAFLSAYPHARIDWMVREDFKGLVKPHPLIDRTIVFSRKQGFRGLLKLAWQLSGENYTHVYDAHSNLRSAAVLTVFRARKWLKGFRGPRLLRRPKERIKRFLFFRLRLPTIPQPFRAAESFLWPLRTWGVAAQAPTSPQFHTNAVLPNEVSEAVARLNHPRIALAPSAAWEMKRWPVKHWKTLVSRWPDARFIILGGPADHFLEEICIVAPDRTLNTAGKLSLAQSAALLKECDLVIANDTGLLHVADQMERPTLALIGPTAFGYPSHSTSKTVEIQLPCKPCSKDGRGGCTNSVYQRCLVDLTPDRVLEAGRELLKLKD